MKKVKLFLIQVLGSKVFKFKKSYPFVRRINPAFFEEQYFLPKLALGIVLGLNRKLNADITQTNSTDKLTLHL